MSSSTNTSEYDVAIIGAGFAGLYALHKLRDNKSYRDSISTNPNFPNVETNTVGNGSYLANLWKDGEVFNLQLLPSAF